MSATGEPFERVDVHRAKQLIDQGVTVIDVRNPDELPKDGAIADTDTKLVPLNTFLMNPRQHLQDARESDGVLFMCKVGQRSAIACEMAAAVGLTKLYNLEGGIEAWKKAGLPVEFPQKG